MRHTICATDAVAMFVWCNKQYLLLIYKKRIKSSSIDFSGFMEYGLNCDQAIEIDHLVSQLRFNAMHLRSQLQCASMFYLCTTREALFKYLFSSLCFRDVRF